MKIKMLIGGYGYKAPGSTFVELKDKNSAPFDVDDAEGARLLKLGIAERVTEEEIREEEKLPWTVPEIDVVDDLTEFSYKELQNIAKEMGLSAAGSKEDLIERITTASEEPPILEAANPE